MCPIHVGLEVVDHDVHTSFGLRQVLAPGKLFLPDRLETAMSISVSLGLLASLVVWRLVTQCVRPLLPDQDA